MLFDFSIKFDKIDIQEQNKDFIIINKPSGLLVHPTKYQRKNTLVDWLLVNFPEIKKIGEKDRPGIVHRLDKEVSGLMVIAKSQEMYFHLLGQFKKKKVKKEYLALTYNHFVAKNGIIDLFIGRTKKGKLVANQYENDIRNKKSALTEYRVEKEFFSPQKLSLLKVSPLTGRTNQIRIHLYSLGCPVVGDKRYKKRNLFLKEPLKIKRIFLHACYLGFYNLKNKWLEYRIFLPIELQEFLKKIK
jgi:23S rRNA pseudouridine1911/1915/1917 synthase